MELTTALSAKEALGKTVLALDLLQVVVSITLLLVACLASMETHSREMTTLARLFQEQV